MKIKSRKPLNSPWNTQREHVMFCMLLETMKLPAFGHDEIACEFIRLHPSMLSQHVAKVFGLTFEQVTHYMPR